MEDEFESFREIDPLGWENVMKPLRVYAASVTASGKNVGRWFGSSIMSVINADMMVIRQHYERGHLPELPGWTWVRDRWSLTEHYSKVSCKVFTDAKRAPKNSKTKPTMELIRGGNIRSSKFHPFIWASEQGSREGIPHLVRRLSVFHGEKPFFIKIRPGEWEAIADIYVTEGLAWPWAAVVEDVYTMVNLMITDRRRLPGSKAMASRYGMRPGFSATIHELIAPMKSLAPKKIVTIKQLIREYHEELKKVHESGTGEPETMNDPDPLT